MTLRYVEHHPLAAPATGVSVFLSLLWVCIACGLGLAAESGNPDLQQAVANATSAEDARADRIGFVQYEYSQRTGQLVSVLTKNRESDTAVISYNTFAYDDHQNLIEEVQSIGSATITSSKPRIGYEWSYAHAGTTPGVVGRQRLETMTYPEQAGQAARSILLGYSNASAADDPRSHIAALKTRVGTGASSELAGFTHTGTGRRASMTLGEVITQDFGASGVVGLPGLDQFGRLRDLWYKAVVSGQPHTLHRAEYAYDENGARITARITRAATPSAEEVNVWSQWNSYNQLGQLKETLFGSLSGGTISAPLLQDSWSLDALGNWNDLPNAGVSPLPRA